MRRFAVLLLLFTSICFSAQAAKKATVRELKDTLSSFLQAKKTDQETATRLKEMELSEQLTLTTKNSLLAESPGPLTTEQIYVLEGESADLVPPTAELPDRAAPDQATKDALLAKAQQYVTDIYEELPALAARKTVLRFQDNVEAVAQSSGIVGNAKEVDTGDGFSNPAAFVHYINSAQADVQSDHGAEKRVVEKVKIPWGANKMIALEEPDPSLGAVFREAREAGKLQWVRWETVNGNPAAVYSYAVPRKTSRLALDVCCFPNVTQVGIARFYTGTSAAALAGSEAAGGGGGGVTGNYQTSTDWHDYKTSAPYHGELYIDPKSGIVVRMIVEAELKPTETMHVFDERVDYGPTAAGNRTVVAPVRTIVNTVVVPNGDSYAGGYKTRRTLFISEYKEYRESGGQ
ncbi:MAG: hypothetical protein ABSF17_01215 [Terracidiphilus sp.]|jgi:hypothetical protein